MPVTNQDNVLDLGVGSHAPVLALAVARTTGRILECGMGDYSTPLLHLAAMAAGRRVTSLETDATWYARFAPMARGTHYIRHIVDWSGAWEIEHWPYEVAFIDCAPGEERPAIALRLRSRCKWIIVHDSEADIPPAGGNYGWAKLFPQFKYVTTCDLWRPWTTILSDEEEFKL